LPNDPQEILMTDITMDETPPERPTNTITEAWLFLWNNPSQFVRYWNYKGAILSGVLRAPIFFATYLIGKESLRLAFAAATLQFLFRFFFAGIGGALIQSFRRVEPAWKAILSILMLLPLVSHLFEFGLQFAFGYVTGTQDRTDEAILRSISVSIISALFTLFAMRRGIMIVGESESKSLFSDISRLPIIIFHFVAFIPNEISSMLRRGAYLGALLGIAAFGVFSQIVMWALMNKPAWSYSGGKQIFPLSFWGVDGMILLSLTIALSSFVYSRKHQG
jgi:hypothetical protein